MSHPGPALSTLTVGVLVKIRERTRIVIRDESLQGGRAVLGIIGSYVIRTLPRVRRGHQAVNEALPDQGAGASSPRRYWEHG